MYYVLYITSYDTCILLRMEIKQANINHALNIKTIPIKKTTIKNTNQTKLKILSLIFFWQILNFLIQLYFYHFISFRMKMSSENSFVKPVCNIFFFNIHLKPIHYRSYYLSNCQQVYLYTIRMQITNGNIRKYFNNKSHMIV